MGRRKLIGLIMANPEAVYQQRILDGVFAACHKYGYNVAVFTPLVQVCHFYKEYLDGELNIFELMNFDNLDGIIVAAISLSENQITWVCEYIGKKLKRECRKPVVSLDLPLEDYPVIYTDDRRAFTKIAAHVMDAHECRRVYFLTGMKGYPVSEQRLDGFKDLLISRGMPVDESCFFYGDFWYSGGEALAEKIVSGEVPMPDAVICASDHMAIGLANRLIEHGIKVPEDIVITGYDATAEAAINSPTITTYIPDVFQAMDNAINCIREQIEPGAEIIHTEGSVKNGLRICSSCGCPENVAYIKKCLNESLYKVHHNYAEKNIRDTVDISRLLDSYVYEIMTESPDPEKCLWNIYFIDYLIRPYDGYYLCLTENWLDTEEKIIKGYPERMNCVIRTVPTDDPVTDRLDERHVSIENDHVFDTSLMLPQLYEEREEPAAFYFVPMHFNNNTVGYSVLQCSLTQEHKIGCVYRNWIRSVNNALEMARARNKLQMLSERDVMTGLFNRRGMDTQIRKMLKNAKEGQRCAVFVIDMDGLKYINDNFGHTEGDIGISIIASAAQKVCRSSEICVRAGGDEFYIIGIGDYTSDEISETPERFVEALKEESGTAEKPYEISASIGYACQPVTGDFNIDNVINAADANMYENKTARKKQRRS